VASFVLGVNATAHLRGLKVSRASSVVGRKQAGPGRVSSERVVDFGSVRRSQPEMTDWKPADVRSNSVIWLTSVWASELSRLWIRGSKK
jgi:hypothetical protein